MSLGKEQQAEIISIFREHKFTAAWGWKDDDPTDEVFVVKRDEWDELGYKGVTASLQLVVPVKVQLVPYNETLPAEQMVRLF